MRKEQQNSSMHFLQVILTLRMIFQCMGARSVFLLNTFEKVPKLPVDAKSFDFKMNKVMIVFVMKENWWA